MFEEKRRKHQHSEMPQHRIKVCANIAFLRFDKTKLQFMHHSQHQKKICIRFESASRIFYNKICLFLFLVWFDQCKPQRRIYCCTIKVEIVLYFELPFARKIVHSLWAWHEHVFVFVAHIFVCFTSNLKSVNRRRGSIFGRRFVLA